MSRLVYPHVPYVMWDNGGDILQTGDMAIGHVEDKIAAGELILIGRCDDPANTKVAGGKLKPKSQADIKKRQRKDAETQAAREASLPAVDRRAAAYPRADKFMEAFTERELGDDTKWKAYLAEVQAVKAKFPKE